MSSCSGRARRDLHLAPTILQTYLIRKNRSHLPELDAHWVYAITPARPLDLWRCLDFLVARLNWDGHFVLGCTPHWICFISTVNVTKIASTLINPPRPTPHPIILFTNEAKPVYYVAWSSYKRRPQNARRIKRGRVSTQLVGEAS